MIVAYFLQNGSLKAVPVAAGSRVPPEAVWIDISSPTPLEDDAIEAVVGIEIPTREEMAEIEQSSRLYDEKGARYMTAALLCGPDGEVPSVVAVTFILAGKRLITVRYNEPRAFPIVATRLGRVCPQGAVGETVLVELLEAIVDRDADLLEQIGVDVDRLSRRVFDRSNGQPRSGEQVTPKAAPKENANQRYRAILSHIGRKEGLVSKARESLASLQRLLSFLGTDTETFTASKDAKAAIKSMSRDVAGLSDYAAFIGDKLQFLLDATIGLVSLEQNNIIKIFAVLSVVLMPPTLIASIYGMNFQHMPELAWSFGYPVALVAMVAAAIMPYVFFKWRGWL